MGNGKEASIKLGREFRLVRKEEGIGERGR